MRGRLRHDPLPRGHIVPEQGPPPDDRLPPAQRRTALTFQDDHVRAPKCKLSPAVSHGKAVADLQDPNPPESFSLHRSPPFSSFSSGINGLSPSPGVSPSADRNGHLRTA